MKISEYVVVIYNFQTGITNRSILVKKHCFIVKLISWPWEGAIQLKEFIIYNFITLDSISTWTTINEYCRNAYASIMLIWTKFMTPYQNFVIPLITHSELLFNYTVYKSNLRTPCSCSTCICANLNDSSIEMLKSGLNSITVGWFPIGKGAFLQYNSFYIVANQLLITDFKKMFIVVIT